MNPQNSDVTIIHNIEHTFSVAASSQSVEGIRKSIEMKRPGRYSHEDDEQYARNCDAGNRKQ